MDAARGRADDPHGRRRIGGRNRPRSRSRPHRATRDDFAPVASDRATPSGSGAPSPRTASTPSRGARPDLPPRSRARSPRRPQQGLIPFLIASAIGGLFALVMPCVWPMVPITVNFFVKQGQGKARTGQDDGPGHHLLPVDHRGLHGGRCPVLVLLLGSRCRTWRKRRGSTCSSRPCSCCSGSACWDLFEIRLPSFLLNASAQGESRGGLVGVIFMALTLTITSFTCTFPVVGGLLVMAASGDFFYPIIGLATFATVLAFPFFLLALSPSLISKMPRSGDWMNAVKVVGGLVEIGAALKFINTAELAFVTPENAWFDAQVVLTSWVVLSLVCGLYLLGVFRTDHDHDEVKVGPGRLVFGAAFLGLALFLLPALFGRLPQSQVWNRLIVGILPPDSSELQCTDPGRRRGGERVEEVEGHLHRPGPGRTRTEELPRRPLGHELRPGPRAGRGREEADPDRLHRRQLCELPADGDRRLPAPRGRLAAQEIRDRPALHGLRAD